MGPRDLERQLTPQWLAGTLGARVHRIIADTSPAEIVGEWAPLSACLPRLVQFGALAVIETVLHGWATSQRLQTPDPLLCVLDVRPWLSMRRTPCGTTYVVGSCRRQLRGSLDRLRRLRLCAARCRVAVGVMLAYDAHRCELCRCTPAGPNRPHRAPPISQRCCGPGSGKVRWRPTRSHLWSGRCWCHRAVVDGGGTADAKTRTQSRFVVLHKLLQRLSEHGLDHPFVPIVCVLRHPHPRQCFEQIVQEVGDLDLSIDCS